MNRLKTMNHPRNSRLTCPHPLRPGVGVWVAFGAEASPFNIVGGIGDTLLSPPNALRRLRQACKNGLSTIQPRCSISWCDSRSKEFVQRGLHLRFDQGSEVTDAGTSTSRAFLATLHIRWAVASGSTSLSPPRTIRTGIVSPSNCGQRSS